MKQVLIRRGKINLTHTPAPQLEPGHVLVEVRFSCISSGTELSSLKLSGMPLWKRALRQPHHAKKAFNMLRQYGLMNTRSVIQGIQQGGQPTGYSAAGIVIAIGNEVTEFAIGDHVACAGAQYAHHAEIISVPKNLVVRMPENVDFPAAATVTLGAIALQGIRRFKPTLGETVVVLGLGLLGQLTAQLLKANGCRVIGIDVQQDRLQLAHELGVNLCILENDPDPVAAVARLTDGLGCDGVIITASTPSSNALALAFQVCRKKARVVLVGDVGLNINREDIYKKELDFFISTSYGPGRYDYQYEEKGLDYPLHFVRWTENRNMAEYLRHLALGSINIKPLISAIYSLDKAKEAYASLEQTPKPLFVLLQYAPAHEVRQQHTIFNSKARARKGKINLAIIGAGHFTKGIHLPNLRRLHSEFNVHAIMSRSGHNSLALCKQFQAQYATTDWQHVLQDPDIHAVLIATRHHLHAEQALQALRAGKHVFVEKPLALNAEQLYSIMDFFSENNPQSTLLLTGFNRRFSPYILRIKEIIQRRNNPMIINYRMNAGALPNDHWIYDATQGGGRNIGEACHIYDLFTYLTQSHFIHVSTAALTLQSQYYRRDDNFVTTITFADGSLATLTYTALGHKDHPKEMLEIFVDGKVINLLDYRALSIVGLTDKDYQSKIPQKGHLEELALFAQAITQGLPSPIPLWQQFQAMQIAFTVEEQLAGNK